MRAYADMAGVGEGEDGEALESVRGTRPHFEVLRGSFDAGDDDDEDGEVNHAAERKVGDEAQRVELLHVVEGEHDDPPKTHPELPVGQHLVPAFAGVAVAGELLDDLGERVADDDEVRHDHEEREEEDEEVVHVARPRVHVLRDPLEVHADLRLADRLVLLELVGDEAVGDLDQQPDGVPPAEREDRREDDAEDDADLHVRRGDGERAHADDRVHEVNHGRPEVRPRALHLDGDRDAALRLRAATHRVVELDAALEARVVEHHVSAAPLVTRPYRCCGGDV